MAKIKRITTGGRSGAHLQESVKRATSGTKLSLQLLKPGGLGRELREKTAHFTFRLFVLRSENLREESIIKQVLSRDCISRHTHVDRLLHRLGVFPRFFERVQRSLEFVGFVFEHFAVLLVKLIEALHELPVSVRTNKNLNR